MSFTDIEQPPAKKRRFFAEESPVADSTFHPEPSLPDEINALPESSPSLRIRASSSDVQDRTISDKDGEQDGTSKYSKRDAPQSTNGVTEGFDTKLFASFAGEEVAPDILKRLREVSGDNVERAINMYFDGSWQHIPSSAALRTSQNATPSSLAPAAARPKSVSQQGSNESPLVMSAQSLDRHPDLRPTMPEWRYVGAFGVGAWATRSGSTLIKHGEAIKIERQKIQPPTVKSARGRPASGIAVQKPRPNFHSKRTDIIVRFTNLKGEEVGRLPKDTAAWVSTLIDQRVCRFEGSCVFVPERVRINDTIYLQLRCSLLRKAFEAGGFIKPEDNNRTTGIFEEKESQDEKDLRLRQVSLVKLFDEINLHPSRTSETTEKHKRQGLLQAAEVAEQYDKEDSAKKAKAEEESGSSPAASEETEDGKELEQDQLDTLYKKAQSFDFNTPEAEPPDTFVMNLRRYQKQALHWMTKKEKDEKSENKEVSMHPLWEEYSWPDKDVDDKDVPGVVDQDKFYINPYSGELSLDYPIQEQNCLGGILADGELLQSTAPYVHVRTILNLPEMGLGKTIEMLSLMHSHKSEIALESSSTGPSSVNSLPRLPKSSSSVERAPCTTLVVAPMSLLAQWQSEAENASKAGTLKTMVYYGSDKAANIQNLCCEANAATAPNLIITSYGVVLSESNQVAANSGNRGSHGGLFSVEFFRVILDEGHHIKNRQSKTAKACYEISAEHRWVLTGTPIVNRLEDLFSLVRFLRVEPWSNFSFWKTFITAPFESKDFIRALDVVQTVLEPLVLRRTKDMKTPDGKALVPLPLKTIEIEEIELSKPEREVYDHIFTRAKRTFAANIEAGTVLKSYTTIFAQILRLRQSCCHPILTRNKTIAAEEEEAAAAADIANGLADDMDLQELIDRFTSDEGEQDANKYGAHVLKQIQDEAGNECPICAEEPMIEQTVTGCWHSACKKCLFDYIEHQKDNGELPRCFNCREPINQRDVFEVIKHDDDLYASEDTSKITLRRIGSNSSAKITALLTHLKRLRRENSSMKSVVFSQFTSFLDLIEPALTRDNIPFLRFDGSMAQKQRAAVLTEFASHKRGIVLLLSLRAGGVGLNLTQAKRVFMMDPWWSFAVEAQAIDRVHRMGQEDAVTVHRFIVKESVEHRMLKIQDRKKFIASSLGMMSDEEKKMQRIEDIKELLS
ncbi:MAG: DNA helicase rad5 [Pycnora praestabilis]|nr:MAG: DNA helicase rad5 [Pycnora praestabilis]